VYRIEDRPRVEIRSALMLDAIDPVCGMKVDPGRGGPSCTHAGRTYHFCAPGCLQRFRAEPGRFLAEPTATTESGVHTCPMHPEVRHDGPGTCPKCGMALEPLIDRGAKSPELADMVRRFRVASVLTGPLVLIAMMRHVPGVSSSLAGEDDRPHRVGPRRPSLWAGFPFHAPGDRSSRSPNMFTPIAPAWRGVDGESPPPPPHTRFLPHAGKSVDLLSSRPRRRRAGAARASPSCARAATERLSVPPRATRARRGTAPVDPAASPPGRASSSGSGCASGRGSAFRRRRRRRRLELRRRVDDTGSGSPGEADRRA
jgi:YHS domain-containing protein